MRWVNKTARALGLLGLFLSLSAPLFAQDTPVGPVGAQVATDQTPAAATNSDALRNAAQNPIASLISVPLQDNFNFNIGPADRTQNVLNIQPVIPLKVSKNWNLIVRWIVPVIYQPIPVGQGSGAPVQTTGVYGLGDMNPSFFLSPSKPHKIIWGVGPTLVFPTATNTTYLGQGKFSMGPSVVALVQPAHWTIGFLANNIWSVAGQSDFNSAGAVNKPPVNQFLLQWFANYNMKKGWYLTTSPIITANWRAPRDGALGRRCGKNHEARIPAGKHHRSVLRQPYPSREYCAVGRAVTVCVALPQTQQGAREDVAGAKTETDESGATTEELNESNRFRNAR